MTKRSRHGSPSFVSGEEGVQRLARVVLGGGQPGAMGESFVQTLVHDHPELIPTAEIEPAFTPLISVCRELPLSAGYLDNLWVTPEGMLVLGECKLVKNPQARREVIAQALDYARAMSGLSLPELEEAVCRTSQRAADTLWACVSERSELDEAQFNDAVARRLKRGNFLILIIGDGIQEGVEDLTEYMQLHAGLRTSLALVEMSLWRDGERMLVVPRVPAKTVLVERGVVRVEDGEVWVGAPHASSSDRFSLTEEAYFDDLAKVDGTLPARLKAFLNLIEPLGVEPEFQKTLVLRYSAAPDQNLSLGYLGRNGKAYNSDAAGSARRLGIPDVGEAYAEDLARIVKGSIRRRSNGVPFVHGPDGRALRLDDLLRDSKGWAAAIEKWATAVQAAADARTID